MRAGYGLSIKNAAGCITLRTEVRTPRSSAVDEASESAWGIFKRTAIISVMS